MGQTVSHEPEGPRGARQAPGRGERDGLCGLMEMRAHYRDIHPPFQAMSSAVERLFILLRALLRARVTLLGPIADIPWSRLRGLVAPSMRRPSPLTIRIAPRQAALLLFCALVASPHARAQDLSDEPVAEPVHREILAVYDSREEARPDQTRIHHFAEMPLNHLGFVLSYWDVNAGLPSAERSAHARGVITWFRRAPPSAFYLWGLDRLADGARMVVLGDSGLPSGNAPLADANRMFREIGFGLSGAVVDITYAARILYQDALVGFERPLDPVLPAFPIVGTLGAEVTSHLVIEHREGDLVLASSVVLTSNHGGYAASGYTIYEEPATGRNKWIIDPF